MKARNTTLIALKNGLAPWAEPLVCGDLTGPDSLFGEGLDLPRPACALQEEAGDAFFSEPRVRRAQPVVLWKENGAPSPFSVCAPTYLAGTCTSTFDVAWQLHGLVGLPVWGAVLSVAQKEGRGQLRRPWHSPRGNLYATFRLPDDPLFATAAAAVATGYLLALALGDLGFSLSLKWPNDLLDSRGRKVGGILLEERAGVLMAGIGINIAEAPAVSRLRENAAAPAGVLFREDQDADDEPLAPFGLWRLLVAACKVAYEENLAGRSLSDICTALEPLLAWRGRRVSVTEAGLPPLYGKYVGLAPSGALRVCGAGGCTEVFGGSLSLVETGS